MMTLRTEKGGLVTVRLDNWGDGVDELHRRWTLRTEGWKCIETGELAHQVPPEVKWGRVAVVAALGIAGFAVIALALVLLVGSK